MRQAGPGGPAPATDIPAEAILAVVVDGERKLGAGERDVTVEFAGVEISPGDYVYADTDGAISSEKELL
jgi:regulator of ribonuclease activity A